MPTLRPTPTTRSALNLGLAMAMLSALVFACSDDASDSLTRRGGPGSSGGASSSGSSGDPNAPGAGGVPLEQKLFSELEPELQKKCGATCHTDATYKPVPPAFMAPPDAYKSIKSHPGLITRDVYQSALLTKGAHAGPAASADPEFEKKLIAWLEAESLAIQSQRLPTTDPIQLTNGPNDIDLSKACVGGLTGVHLKFNASLVGTILSFSNMVITAPAGTDVHILKPKFFRVLAQPAADGTREYSDPQDSFSNTDQTVPGGADTPLAPGSVFFSGTGWTGFDFGADKIRVEAEKIEPGKVQVVQQAPTCKNVANFTANVLPSLRGGNGFTPNCAGCHGNGLAGLALNGADNALICQQVQAKLNQANIAGSLMITKVTAGPHNGGLVNNAANWQALFVNNAAVFF